jgi:hypothetical protein
MLTGGAGGQASIVQDAGSDYGGGGGAGNGGITNGGNGGRGRVLILLTRSR